jgi:hypothetical protein
MTKPFWFSELLAYGKGPDWIFNLAFAPDSSKPLAAAVRERIPAGFTRYQATQRPCPIHTKQCDYDLYIDTPHYQDIVDHLEGRQRPNSYIYHTIQICQEACQIERGYGVDHAGDAETRLVRALAQAPALAMTSWSIVYGGVTYPYQTLISGASSTSLLAYLDAEQL